MNLRAGSVSDGDGDKLLDDIFPIIKLCRDLLGAMVETLPKQVIMTQENRICNLPRHNIII